MRPWIAGTIAGAGATIPMTAVMFAWRRILPAHEQYSLPPRQITAELAERSGAAEAIDHDEEVIDIATTVNHFGYGAAMGLGYGLLAASAVPPRVLTGIAFGSGVWAVSYLGWLPLMNMRAAATKEPAGRNAMMIAAHLVWGAALGGLTARLLSDARR